MRRGSTPTFVVSLPVHRNMISSVSVSIVQDGAEILSVSQDDMVLGDYTASFYLSAEQTLAFKAGTAELQLTVTDVLGTVAVSDIRHIAVRRKLPEDA